MIAADLANVQVWVATTPVDIRKSFDGLAEVVRSFLGRTIKRDRSNIDGGRLPV
jgi:hypothetical protein